MTVSRPARSPSAVDIATRVRLGQLSAVTVVEEHLARIAEREPDVHAFNFVMADDARARAMEVDRLVAGGHDPGPLAGVPVALKDLLCTRRVPTTCSSRILEGWLPPYDATVVTRLAAAGAIAIGKTNMDEFAMGSSTEHSASGPPATRTTSAGCPAGLRVGAPRRWRRASPRWL